MTDVAYRSPFRTWTNYLDDPLELAYWIDRREAYANGDDGALVMMLRYVTIDNPPDAPKRRQFRAPELSLGTFLLLYVTIVGVIAGVVFGVFA